MRSGGSSSSDVDDDNPTPSPWQPVAPVDVDHVHGASERVKINVGGRIYETYVGTLVK